jgi:CRISPR/Cas system-associated protein Cas10 (large subunit of type III CRISPR-Cas system)
VYVALYEFSTGKKRTAVMDIFSNSTIVYSAVVNAIILLYMNQEVRNSFIQLLKDIKSIFIKYLIFVLLIEMSYFYYLSF